MSEKPIKQLFNVYSTLMNPKTPSSVVPESNSAPPNDQTNTKHTDNLGVNANIGQPRKVGRPNAKAQNKTKPLKRKKENNSGPSKKSKRFQWSDALHRQFMGCIFDIGLRQAKPKLLLENLRDNSGRLTTEHIKSHLQKYRSNSKKTKEIFLQQFEIARQEAVQNHVGKAINPGFHAYPMPVGNYPLPDIDMFPDQRINQNGSRNIQISSKGNNAGIAKLVPQNEMTPANQPYQKDLTNGTMGQQGNNQIEHPQPRKANTDQQPLSASDMFDALAAWSPSPLLQSDLTQHQLDLNKQMEEQMEMHKKIQMQHQFQHRRDVGSSNAIRSGSFDLLEDEIQQLFKSEKTNNPLTDSYFVDDNNANPLTGDGEDLFKFLQE